jgi:hypothetical protein
MPPEALPHQSFRASLARATRAPEFYARFYRRFMGSSEQVGAFFRGRDMGRIERKLRMTLEMVCDNADGQPGLDMYLELLGRTHAAMRISLPLLRLWREALIGTAAECDPAFDAEARAAWEAVLDDLIGKMRLPH